MNLIRSFSVSYQPEQCMAESRCTISKHWKKTVLKRGEDEKKGEKIRKEVAGQEMEEMRDKEIGKRRMNRFWLFIFVIGCHCFLLYKNIAPIFGADFQNS